MTTKSPSYDMEVEVLTVAGVVYRFIGVQAIKLINQVERNGKFWRADAVSGADVEIDAKHVVAFIRWPNGKR